jgi:hypothetical protein
VSDLVRDRIYLGTALNGVRDALDLDPDVDEKTYHKHVRKLKADLAVARARLEALLELFAARPDIRALLGPQEWSVINAAIGATPETKP